MKRKPINPDWKPPQGRAVPFKSLKEGDYFYFNAMFFRVTRNVKGGRVGQLVSDSVSEKWGVVCPGAGNANQGDSPSFAAHVMVTPCDEPEYTRRQLKNRSNLSPA